jgi:hypothetical protein
MRLFDMGQVTEKRVLLPHSALSNADWADGWQTPLPVGRFGNARELGNAIIGNFPIWIWPMLALRNLIVLPFGLNRTTQTGNSNKIGFFPVCDESENRIVAGLDDRHLDFRIIIDLENKGSLQNSVLTTVIRRHNWLGKTYLAMVIPFHRAVIKAALAKL